MMQKHSGVAGGDATEMLLHLVGPIAGRLAAAGVAEVVNLVLLDSTSATSCCAAAGPGS